MLQATLVTGPQKFFCQKSFIKRKEKMKKKKKTVDLNLTDETF